MNNHNLFYEINQMIFLMQFGINLHYKLHSPIFQRLQIALAIRARAIWLVFEKFTCADLSQIALEIMWLPILILICTFFNLHIFVVTHF